MDRQAYWESVYEAKPTEAVSWYETAPTRSLALLTEAGLTWDSRVIDVGGGDSALPGALLEYGVRRLTDVHWTPAGAEQRFAFAVLSRV